MSAYRVKNKTINSIVAGIAFAKENGYRYGPSCDEREYLLLGSCHLCDLGFALAWMNQDALDDRYRGELDAVPYAFQKLFPPPLVQLIKSIKCLLYQCMEGDIDQRPLYQELEQFGLRAADALVSMSQAYEKAVWG